ncbi:MAG: hypothetical protein M0011_02155 [Elusimicrobia bacterium]|nr:hypothetical protein [Elusimicrobiota bacterium]
MSFVDTLGAVVDDPALLGAEAKPAGLGRTGMLGYFAGALGLFVFLRMYSAVPPGFFSFGVVFLLLLALEFFVAGTIHLFMELTGASGRAGRLFQAFGLTDFLMTALVPAGFLAKAGLLGPMLWYTLCALLLIYARVRLVRRLYPVSANKATLSVLLPYAGLFVFLFLAWVYSLAWLIWLMV